MRAHCCCCDIYIGSAIEESVDDGAHTLSDDTKEAWEALFIPSSSSCRDPNRAPTEVAPSTPVPLEEGVPSIPETPSVITAREHLDLSIKLGVGECHGEFGSASFKECLDRVAQATDHPSAPCHMGKAWENIHLT